tara:strand:- start:1495 stop:1788 length:294 start_codon:yes stop_codon:yes gene_type:complete
MSDFVPYNFSESNAIFAAVDHVNINDMLASVDGNLLGTDLVLPEGITIAMFERALLSRNPVRYAAVRGEVHDPAAREGDYIYMGRKLVEHNPLSKES